MYNVLKILNQSLQVQNSQHTKLSLGDRSKYIGLSDIGKGLDCLRSAVATKTAPTIASDTTQNHKSNFNAHELSKHLRLQRGHWFESGVVEAFMLAKKDFIHQLEIEIKHNNIPIKGHLDFVFIEQNQRPIIRIIELKSTESIPKTLYASQEAQLYAQLGLLAMHWNNKVFSVPATGKVSQPKTFPELVKQLFNIDLADDCSQVQLEGYILSLTMNEAKAFGPYKANEIMLNICLETANKIWSAKQDIENKIKTLNKVAYNKAFHPLCDYCEVNASCPKFRGVDVPGLEAELLNLQRLKEAEKQLSQHIKNTENSLKLYATKISPNNDWINAITQRLRVGICAGKNSLNEELLKTELLKYVSTEQISSILQNSYKSDAAYERLYLGKIN
ncbi:PD-(D/E)XK nuclease family protein [Desulfovibrio litoralis]|uniref:PD-(D/E)XK nuclease superfamily protein n=1 Tax=Desulfovibrio litoralis DSM 11393 TaxID=1121455 RepID=A0A1M7TPT5_9BACT|nr:PD-(D/E)XK nuclease family protein [Desulfovibrio litoralis]SHN72700.1 PD-(D/E)XK nuclease superfamily protein [Desulfovibrio litoralis DSM 11393]